MAKALDLTAEELDRLPTISFRKQSIAGAPTAKRMGEEHYTEGTLDDLPTLYPDPTEASAAEVAKAIPALAGQGFKSAAAGLLRPYDNTEQAQEFEAQLAEIDAAEAEDEAAGEMTLTRRFAYAELRRNVTLQAQASGGGTRGLIGEVSPELDESMTTIAGSLSEDAAEREKEIYEGLNLQHRSMKWVATEAGRALIEMGPMLATAIFTRSPNIALAPFGLQVYGRSYDHSKREGLSDLQAKRKAWFDVFAEVAPERVVLGQLMKRGDDFLLKVGKGVLAEGVQEAVTEVLQAGYEKGVLHDDMTWGEAASRIVDAMIIGGAMGGGMGTILGGAEAATNRIKGKGQQRQPAKAETVETKPKPEAAEDVVDLKPAHKVTELSPDDIEVDASVFQFKRGGDEGRRHRQTQRREGVVA